MQRRNVWSENCGTPAQWAEGAENRDAEGVEGVGNEKGIPPPQLPEGSGNVVSSLRGQRMPPAADNDFEAF